MRYYFPSHAFHAQALPLYIYDIFERRKVKMFQYDLQVIQKHKVHKVVVAHKAQ